MIQAVQSNTPVRQTTATSTVSQVQAPQTTASVSSLQFTADTLKVGARGFTDEQALEALNALRQKYGDIRKSAFLSSPKIDNNEALQRLKDGKDIFVTNKSVDRNDYFGSLDELMLLDDLQGRQMDHGVAKPELRLPLLFLSKQKLEPYNSNNDDRQERLDAYNAYSELKKDWRIYINGKDVKPKDLVSYVVAQGWTAEKDPGLSMRATFAKLPANGWQLNGQAVSRDLAYIAWITGDKRLSLDGAAISDEKDFAMMLNLVANEQNNAIDPDLRARLIGIKLSDFNSPVSNHYSVYKHLSTGRALSLAGNTIRNLDDLVIYDALNGSLKPTNLLPAEQYETLRYLSADKGLSVGSGFAAWQSLSSGKNVSYRFNGGATNEPISFSAGSMQELVELKAKVVAQRERDQFRPDLAQAKQIMAERLPQLKDSIQQNLERTRTAVERAKADVPVQEARYNDARQDYDQIKPVYDSALRDMQQAERVYQDAERRYNTDKRDYEWERDKYQRIERDYYSAQRGYETSLNQARNLESQARQEDGLVTSDPTNADAHRQKASQYRQQASAAQSQAGRYQNDMNRLRSDMDRQRWEVQRSERDMERSRQVFWDARSSLDSKKNIYQQQQSQLEDASNRMRQAENQLRIARQTIADGDVVERISLEANQNLQSLQSGMGRLKTYTDYAGERQGLHTAMNSLRQLMQDGTYSGIHGNSLASRTVPLQTLLGNMDKPAKAK